jgi:ABC-2 type transport system ATP-binding protein
MLTGRIIGRVRQLSGHPIAVRSLGRDFGPQRVLTDVDLSVGRGEVHGLLGPPGAGKSTLLRLLAGQIGATRGEALLLGSRAGAPHLRGRVALVEAGGDAAYQRISGFENLTFVGRLHGMTHREPFRRAEALLLEAGLAAAAHVAVGEWTPGMRRRLSVARALMTGPEVLLIDAAATALEPESAGAVRRLVAGRAGRGASVLWAARRLDELSGLAGTVTLLASGRVRYAGTVSALAARSTHGLAGPERRAA